MDTSMTVDGDKKPDHEKARKCIHGIYDRRMCAICLNGPHNYLGLGDEGGIGLWIDDAGHIHDTEWPWLPVEDDYSEDSDPDTGARDE